MNRNKASQDNPADDTKKNMTDEDLDMGDTGQTENMSDDEY